MSVACGGNLFLFPWPPNAYWRDSVGKDMHFPACCLRTVRRWGIKYALCWWACGCQGCTPFPCSYTFWEVFNLFLHALCPVAPVALHRNRWLCCILTRCELKAREEEPFQRHHRGCCSVSCCPAWGAPQTGLCSLDDTNTAWDLMFVFVCCFFFFNSDWQVLFNQ